MDPPLFGRESLDGGFFAVRNRSGDPTTEDLHARTSHPKRLNSGKSDGLRGARRVGDTSTSPSVIAAAAASLAETETHCVVRAGSLPAIAVAAAAAATSSGGGDCSGRALSHGWAFLCADGGVLAWEQGMVYAERPGDAVSADQTCLRFDHPSMVQELADIGPLGVAVEAADLVALTQPWEARGGNREMLLVSPAGLARYWPDLRSPRRFTDVDARSVAPDQSVTRVVALGPADFLCGLSKGGVLRIRPGLARPCLLAQTTSVLGLGFSTIKRMGSFLGQRTLAGAVAAPAAEPPHGGPAATTSSAAATPVVSLSVAHPPPGSPAAIPARVVRLTTETLEVWSVARGGGGTDCLEVHHPLAVQVQKALGARKVSLVDAAVTGATTNVSGHAGGEASSSVVNWGLELLVLAAGGSGAGGEEEEGGGDVEFSVHVVRVSSEEASWVGSSVSVKLVSSHRVTTNSSSSQAGRGGQQHTFPAPAPAPAPTSALAPIPRRRATLATDNEQSFPRGEGAGAAPFGGGGDRGPGGGIVAHVFWHSSSSPRSNVSSASAQASAGTGVATAAQVWSVCVKMGGGDGVSSGGGFVEWEERGAVEVSSRAALVGGCVGGGGALLGCPGVILLSSQGQAVWVAPRNKASGLTVDLGPSPETMMSSEAAAEEWRTALVDEGLRAFEAGKTMDTARLGVESLLSRAALGTGGAIISNDLDAAIVWAGLEVLNGSWRHPSAFASPHQLVHLALREKSRRHRALVRFLMDSGAWGAASAGRAALAECGEKISAAARLCELQDAIARKSVGAKAAGLLEDCIKLSLGTREARGGTAAQNAVTSQRDRYFEHTQGILDAFVELHTLSLDDHAPSSSIDGATLTPLRRALLLDPSLDERDRLPLLNHLSVVVAGVFEAALRHRASERSIYRAGARGRVWTASREARLVLYRQLLAYADGVEGINLQGAATGRGASEGTAGVIGRLSVLLLDGFREEEDVNPAASGRVEWQDEYMEAKALCVNVVAACGREDLARILAEKHRYLEGTLALCHQAELRKPGCHNGHNFLRQRMRMGDKDEDEKESEDARLERENFSRFVLDWHLRRGFKTALLDVGAAVPNILCEFLADWREAELLWIFQIRNKDYTGAGRALTRGSPPPTQKGGKPEAQHLWLSLAKLAFLSGDGGDDNASADPARGADIQRRLELAEVRERLIKSLPPDAAMNDNNNSDEPWTWEDALEESVRLLNYFSQQGSPEEADIAYDVKDASDIAFQGYRALVVGLPEGSFEQADSLWREVVGLTLTDPHVREAVAKGAMPSAADDRTAATDREMEAIWKRPTVLHLLLRAIQNYRRLRRDSPCAGGAGSGAEERVDLTDESLSSMVHELMPAAADGRGATCDAWIAAIRKCPWS